MITLHFEAADGDELRETGFSKVGRHQDPQIYRGLLISATGFPIGYDIYEGGIYEGRTLIPFIKKFEKKFSLSKPVVVANSGLLNLENIDFLESEGYTYILGARIKNKKRSIKQQILSLDLKDGKNSVIDQGQTRKLIVSCSAKRAIELTKNMYQLSIDLPENKMPQNLILRMDDEQQLLYSILNKFY
jgi:transposase